MKAKLIDSASFLLVDFCLGERYTHHYDYLIRYQRFLQSNGAHPLSVFVPRSGRRMESQDMSSQWNYRLWSRRYVNFHSLKLSEKSVYVFVKMVERMAASSRNPQFKVKAERLIAKVLGVLSFRSVKKYLIDQLKNSQVIIVCPTLDDMAVEMIRRIDRNFSQSKSNLHYRLRILDDGPGSNSDDSTADIRFLDFLRIKNVDVKIGFETHSNLSRFLNKPDSYPFDLHLVRPPIFLVPKGLKGPSWNSCSNLTIGFLGMAKARKGFSRIPEIISEIANEFPESTFIVQGSSVNWDGYQEQKNAITSLSKSVKLLFIEGDLGYEELLRRVQDCSIIVLPYSAESYKYSGSAILFMAAEQQVPVIASPGTGFASDIVEYGLGGLCNKDWSREVTRVLALNPSNTWNLYADKIQKENFNFLFVQ